MHRKPFGYIPFSNPSGQSLSPQSIHAYILGKHGDSEVPVWNSASIADLGIKDRRKYNQEALAGIVTRVRKAAYEIMNREEHKENNLFLALFVVQGRVPTPRYA